MTTESRYSVTTRTCEVLELRADQLGAVSGITSRGDDAVRQLGEACRLLAELGGEQSAESPPSVGSDNYRIGIVLAYRRQGALWSPDRT